MVAVVAASLASACGANGAAAARTERATVAIQAAHVDRIDVDRTVDISGTLASPDQARVSSEVAGIVRAVLVELGQEVTAGQVLVQLEPRELVLARERAESALRQIEAQLGMSPGSDAPPGDEQIASVRTAAANVEDARATLSRVSQLSTRGLLSTVELESAQTRAKVAAAAYQASIENVRSLTAVLQDRRAALALAEKKVSDAVIRAPVVGAIAERAVQVGEFIRENTPVVTIVRLDPLKLRTAVQERHAGAMRPGLPLVFRVASFPNQSFSGRIAYISPSVDQGTRTIAVEGLVDNRDHRLKPGFFATGKVVMGRDEGVIASPEEAVSTIAGVSSVYVVEQNKVRQQVVSLGLHTGRHFEILDGLTGDEMLATSNLSQLATGVAVRVVDAASDAASPGRVGTTP